MMTIHVMTTSILPEIPSALLDNLQSDQGLASFLRQDAAIMLLGLGIGAALASRALRLNPIVGYLGLGLGLASLGIADDFSGPVVAAMAEAGVMFLLFNLGLHFSLGRIRAEAANIFGFGSLQMLVSGGAFAALFAAFGLPFIQPVQDKKAA